VEELSDLMKFPSEEYWEWKPIVKEPGLIAPGSTYGIVDEKGCGYFFYCLIVSTSPDVKICIDMYADGVIEVKDTIKELEQGGASASSIFKICRYDDFTPIYVVEIAPGVTGFPGIPFRGYNKMWLENTAKTPIYVPVVTGWLIKLKEGS